jgi:hypothetical protein
MKLKNNKTDLPEDIKSIIDKIYIDKEKNQESSEFAQELLNYVERYRSEINAFMCNTKKKK